MKWCCDGFKQAYDDRYDRTIYVYPSPPKPEYDFPDAFFWIAMRCIEQKELAKGPIGVTRKDLAITIATQRPIKYCPWCGRNLREFYGSNPTQLYDEVIINEFPD